jgi:exopolysaccharide production protein ExoQ
MEKLTPYVEREHMNTPSRTALEESDRSSSIFLAWILGIIIVVILIGPTPLQPVDGFADIEDTGGSLARQIILLVLFYSTIFMPIVRNRISDVSLPISFLIFFIWSALTLYWSVLPDVGIRRFILTVGVTVSMFTLVHQIGPNKSLTVLFYSITFIVILDLLSVGIFPNTVHEANSSDQTLVGLWRGVHPHKNIASAVAFFGILLSWFPVPGIKKSFRVAALMLSAVLLFGSGSKTTVFALVPIATIMISLHLFRDSKTFVMTAAYIGSLTVAALVIVLATVDWQIGDIITPSSFTGRGSLWLVMIKYLSDNYFGAGFSTFWNVGLASPALIYGDQRIALAPHGHNGYLEILVTTGYVGGIICLFALIFRPLLDIFSLYKNTSSMFYITFGIYIYVLISNVTETSFFSGSRPSWLIFVIALAIAHACKFQKYQSVQGT